MVGTQVPLSGTETVLIGLVVFIVVIPSVTWELVQHFQVMAHEGTHWVVGSLSRTVHWVELKPTAEGATLVLPNSGTGFIIAAFAGYLIGARWMLHPAVHPPTRQPPAREVANLLRHRLLHLPGHRRIQLAQPGPLTVPSGPDQNRLAQVMQLGTAMAGAGPHVRQRAAELGVPHQRRQVLDGHRHADVVHRAVGRHLDRAVCHGMPPEQPNIPGARQVHRLVQGDARRRHGLT